MNLSGGKMRNDAIMTHKDARTNSRGAGYDKDIFHGHFTSFQCHPKTHTDTILTLY